MKYNIKIHIHLYAAWAASRAASTSKINRFKVETGQKILEHAEIKDFILNPDGLPDSVINFDFQHRKWREEIISSSKKFADKEFTHGISAKLINIYLKGIIVCGGFYNHPNSKFVHPPIDSIILDALEFHNFNGKAEFWKSAKKVAWSNFDSNFYQKVINEIRTGLNGDPLWLIEEYWRGYR